MSGKSGSEADRSLFRSVSGSVSVGNVRDNILRMRGAEMQSCADAFRFRLTIKASE